MIVIVCGEREALLLAQQLAQRDAGQVLHDEIRHVAVLALVEDVDDVRVGQARRRASLLDEPALEHGVVAQVPVHDLERDAPLEAQIGRDVHGRHAAARDARANPVSAVDQTSDQRVGLLTRAHGSESTDARVRARGAPHPAELSALASPVGREPRAWRRSPTGHRHPGGPRSARPARPA